ncbi:MAG: DUF1847 domain-containing protein, partial [Firmicutes bacterium]|nr:DUF1847 domain-containing protein [Bacillota bacterium]
MSEFFNCADCVKRTCFTQKYPYPAGCRTENMSDDFKEEIKNEYLNDPLDMKILYAAAEVEGKFYGKMTRVEETIAFARRLGAKKIGIASCAGTLAEAGVFNKILLENGFDTVGVACKTGNTDKCELGIPDEHKIKPGGHEPYCNPAMQARIMDDENVDLVVLMGLCVGHDTLFFRH